MFYNRICSATTPTHDSSVGTRPSLVRYYIVYKNLARYNVCMYVCTTVLQVSWGK